MGDEIQKLKHENALQAHTISELQGLLNWQHGPVAYRRWRGEKLQYEYLDELNFDIVVPPEEQAEWEPLYIRLEKQVVM